MFPLSLPPMIWLASRNLVRDLRAPLKQQIVSKVIKNLFCCQIPWMWEVALGSHTLGCEFQLLLSCLTFRSCLILNLISAYVSAVMMIKWGNVFNEFSLGPDEYAAIYWELTALDLPEAFDSVVPSFSLTFCLPFAANAVGCSYNVNHRIPQWVLKSWET